MFSFSSVVCLQNLLFGQKLGRGGLKKLGHTDHEYEPQYRALKSRVFTLPVKELEAIFER